VTAEWLAAFQENSSEVSSHLRGFGGGLSKSIHSLSKEPLNLRPHHRRFSMFIKCLGTLYDYFTHRVNTQSNENF
ncbi:MAG: hypothetical protein E7L01_17880, partial [Paenibacillus macerans]|uniref:hypothetical protein n=1 Tax=Paenibacillus macerans TaxID=44252 RepID=UPI002909B941